MKLFKGLFFVFSLMICSLTVQAEGTHILSASSSSTIRVTPAWTDGYDVYFDTAVDYDHAFENSFMLGGGIALSIFSGGTFTSFSVGPGYNFNSDIANSFFASLKLGVTTVHIDAAMEETDISLFLEVGKRFKLMENVSFVPGITAFKILGENEPDPSFGINLFKFSIVF